MVNEVTVKGREAFACGICQLAYTDRGTAERCEEFCQTYKSCSLEITKQAINI